MVRLNLLALALSTIPLAFAHSSELHSRQEKGGCSTHSTPEFLAAAALAAAEDKADIAALTASVKTIGKFKWPKPTKWIYVPLYIHVVAASKKLEDGWIPNDQLYAQYGVLNDNFGKFRGSLNDGD